MKPIIVKNKGEKTQGSKLNKLASSIIMMMMMEMEKKIKHCKLC